MKVLVIIPAYNESENIPNLMGKINELSYDYLVINDTVEQAVEDVDCIVKAERMKCSRNPELKNKFKGDALK